jgi:hypothetical protein
VAAVIFLEFTHNRFAVFTGGEPTEGARRCHWQFNWLE